MHWRQSPYAEEGTNLVQVYILKTMRKTSLKFCKTRPSATSCCSTTNGCSFGISVPAVRGGAGMSVRSWGSARTSAEKRFGRCAPLLLQNITVYCLPYICIPKDRS